MWRMGREEEPGSVVPRGEWSRHWDSLIVESARGSAGSREAKFACLPSVHDLFRKFFIEQSGLIIVSGMFAIVLAVLCLQGQCTSIIPWRMAVVETYEIRLDH